MITYNDYLNEIKNNNIRRPRVKIELLKADETVYDEITGDVINSGGTLNIEHKNGQTRSVSFDLINIDKSYLPTPDTIWLRQKIRVWLGLEINDEDYFLNQGIFIINNPSAFSGSSEKTISISASDKFALLDGTLGGELNGIYQINAGTNIVTAIKAILKPSTAVLQEVAYDPIEPLIHESFASMETPYTIEKSAGEPIGNILLELAAMVSANVYYSPDGRLMFEPDYNLDHEGSFYDFEAGDFNYISSSQDFPLDKIYNAVLVIGDNINGLIYDALVENNNLTSPTSIPNVGFRRVLVIEDSNINTEALAIARAKYELKRVTNLLIEQSIETVPVYHLYVNSIITVTDPSLNLERKRLLITSISTPISTSGTMTIRCIDTTELYE